MLRQECNDAYDDEDDDAVAAAAADDVAVEYDGNIVLHLLLLTIV